MRTSNPHLGTFAPHLRAALTIAWLGAATGCELAPASPLEPPCAEELAAFEADVYRPVLAVRCIGCHAVGGRAGRSRLVLPRPGSADEAAILAAYESVRSVAIEEIEGQPTLLLRPTNRHPEGHGGGRVIEEGSAEYLALAQFAVNVANGRCDAGTTPSTCETETTGAPVVRRLTPAEYDASIRAVLGVESSHGVRFQPDPVLEGHANLARSLVVNPVLMEQLAAAAEDVVARIDRGRFDGCASGVPADAAAGEACARAVLTSRTARRLMRRPLDEADVERFLAVYRAGANGEGTFDEGLQWMLEALLQSPTFLYRSELGVRGADGARRLDPFEIATELSFLLTGAPPDDALLDRAAMGAFDDEALQSEAARLMATEAHRAHVAQLTTDWLALGELELVHKSETLHPDFTSEVRAAMDADFRAFVREVVFEGDGTLEALLTAPVTSPASAAFLGEGPARAGVLATPAVLTVHARPDRGSPTVRGRLVRERLLCQPVQPPPPDVDANPPPPAAASETFRERMERHASDPACAACHTLMDPIGFGMEGFDEVGRWRTDALDLTGEILDSVSTDGSFDGLDALSTHLASSDEVRACVASQWFTAGTGLLDGPDSGCALTRTSAAFEGEGGAFEALFTTLVSTRHFIERVDPDEAPITLPDAGMPGVDGGPMPTDAGVIGEDAPVTPPDGVLFDERIDSFTGGACHHVVVRNPGTADVEWMFVHDVVGTINSSWNVVRSGDTGSVTFRGEAWNRVARPGDRFEVGYCESR